MRILGKRFQQIKYTKFKRNESCSILRFHRVMYDTSLETCNTQSREKYLRNDNHEVRVFLVLRKLLICGVDIVRWLLNLLYYVIW